VAQAGAQRTRANLGHKVAHSPGMRSIAIVGAVSEGGAPSGQPARRRLYGVWAALRRGCLHASS
jgi:hypothetical protein